MATFVNISNISAVADPILTKLLGPDYLGALIFVGQHFSGLNFFLTKYFLEQKFFSTPNFFYQHFFGPNFV